MKTPVLFLELISNSIILDRVLQYLSLASKFALLGTSRDLRELLLQDPKNLAYLDLTKCRGAYVSPLVKRVDIGGHSWRAERIDENLTEDEFFSGPFRGILSKLNRLRILTGVHTLILDGLASVTLDVISELLQSPQYNIRILSVRDCPHLYDRKLQQLLCYLCRPSRPEGTPKLQGLYIFKVNTDGDQAVDGQQREHLGGITQGDGAQLGAALSTTVSESRAVHSTWYTAAGTVLHNIPAHAYSWNETVYACKGIIAFDAVLCTHMHSEMKSYLHESSAEHLRERYPTIPPIACLALGPSGCAGCGAAPVGTPVWGEADRSEFPLLDPPPFSGRPVDAIRPPSSVHLRNDGKTTPQRLIVSCVWCLTNRYCESCHRWWCVDCFNPKQPHGGLTEGDIVVRGEGEGYMIDTFNVDTFTPVPSRFTGVKVYNNLCVEHCLVPEMMAGAGSAGMWG